MNTLRIVKLIETTLTKRGNGKDDPYRRITEYWDFDGNKIFEIDPCGGENHDETKVTYFNN